MEISEEFISYKKILLFGSQGSGKSSLIKSIEKDISEEESPYANGKILNFILYIIYRNKSEKN
jgi:GTPase SAR1 family protein